MVASSSILGTFLVCSTLARIVRARVHTRVPLFLFFLFSLFLWSSLQIRKPLYRLAVKRMHCSSLARRTPGGGRYFALINALVYLSLIDVNHFIIAPS